MFVVAEKVIYMNWKFWYVFSVCNTRLLDDKMSTIHFHSKICLNKKKISLQKYKIETLITYLSCTTTKVFAFEVVR